MLAVLVAALMLASAGAVMAQKTTPETTTNKQ